MPRVGTEGRHGGGMRRFNAPPPFKPKRDRNVYTLAVPCPDCKAPVDQRCVTAEGTPKATSHRSRRVMALRAERETKEN